MFEQHGNTVMPSVILMKVDHASGNEDEQQATSYIIGGYASHGWFISGGGGMQNSSSGQAGNGYGDDSCFLFNLTLNLRFNARADMPYYQFAKKNELRFGNTDLVISEGFNEVKSEIRVPNNHTTELGRNTGSHFCFGNDLTQKDRVPSIIPSAVGQNLEPS